MKFSILLRLMLRCSRFTIEFYEMNPEPTHKGRVRAQYSSASLVNDPFNVIKDRSGGHDTKRCFQEIVLLVPSSLYDIQHLPSTA